MFPPPLRIPLLLVTSFLAACGARSPLDVTLLTADGSSPLPDASAPDASVDAPPDVAVDAACGMPPPPPSLCTSPQGTPSGLGIAGTLNGVAVESTLCTEVAGNLDLGPTGLAYGSGVAEMALPGQAMVAAVTYSGESDAPIESAIVGYDSDSPLDVDWYCSGPGSTVAVMETTMGPVSGPATLLALKRLGACNAAQGVSGSISYDTNSTMAVTLQGSVTTYPMAEGIKVSSPSFAQIQVNGALATGENAVMMALWFDGAEQLTAGMVLMGPSGPDPGAVYCFTTGTSTPPTPSAVSAFSIGGLRRLGTCATAPAAGACSELGLVWPQ